MQVREGAAGREDVQRDHRIDVDDVAEATLVDQAEHRLHGRTEGIGLVLDHPALRRGGGFAQVEPVRVTRRDRLLDEDVRAAGQRLLRERDVRVHRRGDVHDLGAQIVEQRARSAS